MSGSHTPGGCRAGRRELFLASGGRKNFWKSGTLPPAEKVLWAELCPSPNSCAEAITPRSSEHGWTWSRVFTEGIKVWKVALIPQECVLIRRGHEDIDTLRWMTM